MITITISTTDADKKAEVIALRNYLSLLLKDDDITVDGEQEKDLTSLENVKSVTIKTTFPLINIMP